MSSGLQLGPKLLQDAPVGALADQLCGVDLMKPVSRIKQLNEGNEQAPSVIKVHIEHAFFLNVKLLWRHSKKRERVREEMRDRAKQVCIALHHHLTANVVLRVMVAEPCPEQAPVLNAPSVNELKTPVEEASNFPNSSTARIRSARPVARTALICRL